MKKDVLSLSIAAAVGGGAFAQDEPAAKPTTSFSGYLSTQPADKPIDFDSDEPIAAGKACDLTGDGTCEACQ